VEGADAGRLLEAVRDRLPALRQRLPPGTDLHLVPGPAVPGSEGLIVEGLLPDAAGEPRVRRCADEAGADVERLPDPRAHPLVPAVIDLPAEAASAFRLYVALCPPGERAWTRAEVRSRARDLLARVPRMAGRVTSPWALTRPPLLRAPVVVVVSGPGLEDSIRLADAVRDRLAQSGAVTEVWPDYPRLVPQPSFDVDREKARRLGVDLKDVWDVLQVYLGTADVTALGGLRVGMAPKWRGRTALGLEALRDLKVRNHKGEVVPLGAVVQVRMAEGPAFSRRVNGKRCLLITAEPAAGVTAEEARRRVREIAAQAREEMKLDGYTAECPESGYATAGD
jgi:multidrug efflux pump subunit AcrB